MKVLIISHVPLTTRNNMGKTLLSLFSEFENDELCQMYIYPTVPDVDCCSSYYRVTDKDALKNLLFGEPGGEIAPKLIGETSTLFEEPKDEKIYRNRKNKSALRRLLRDVLWKLTKWNNSRLKSWLDREKPDCIFVAPGVAKFLYDFALQISKDRSIPIVSYVCDEYYFVEKTESAIERLRITLLQSKIRQLMHASDRLVVISEELRSAYSKEFGVEAETLMTGAGVPIRSNPKASSMPQDIRYFGNIRCNRFVSLREIGKELDAINQELGTNYRLRIYTAEKDPGILDTFKEINSVEICGFLTGKAFQEAFESSSLLLHAEAFDDKSVDFVQHSVSTKIADSLASGIPLLAYGPKHISSMQHLMRNACAFLATGREELREVILTAFTDTSMGNFLAKNGLEAARKYHDGKKVSLRLKHILQEVSGKE